MAVDKSQVVVVTGLGVMSGVGNTLDSFWDGITSMSSYRSRSHKQSHTCIACTQSSFRENA